MNKQQLLQQLHDIEWDNFEIKTAQTDIPKDVWETVSAFANTSGGWVVFGVSQKKNFFEIVGVEDPEKYKAFNAPNGYGKYEDFVRFCDSVLHWCNKYPDSVIEANG